MDIKHVQKELDQAMLDMRDLQAEAHNYDDEP